jgi:glycosyltransferase involved in cell wall biosynthesis
MASGRPIVAAAGSAQGLRHKETALVVPNGDVESFAWAILALLEDRAMAARLGQAARSDVEYRYTWPACAAAVENVYRQVMYRVPCATSSEVQG